MDVTVGDFLLNEVRNGGFSVIFSKGSGLSESAHLLLATGLIVSIVIKGILIMNGDLIGSGKALLKMSLWAVIGVSITNPSVYMDFVVLPSINIRDNLAVYLVSNDGYKEYNSTFEAISGSFNYMFNYAWKLVDSGSITSPAPVLAGLIVFIVYGLYYFSIVVNLVLCEVVLSFLFAMGLLIIPISAFETLRGILKSWITLILQYSMVVICSSLFVSILNSINAHAISKLAEMKGIEGILSPWMGLVLLVACFGVLIMKIAFDTSAHLSGGILGSGKDGSSAVSSGLSSAASSMNGIKSLGAKGMSSLVKYKASKA